VKQKPPKSAKKAAPAPPARTELRPAPANAFPIVGLGASAGGLDALEQFLRGVPRDSGMAFVVVQHLDPTHKGILPEILQRATKMPVWQVTDRMKVEPNCVYVIPPNKDMSILNGVLHLLVPVAPRGLRLPIDFFLRSLAEDQKERSVAAILSGMGTDGTLGLRAIKEKGGLVLVQEPATAKFNGMPQSAAGTGLADIIAPVEGLSRALLALLSHRPATTLRTSTALEGRNHSALEKVIILLRLQTGTDFSLYKHSTIYRRIERRMGIHQIEKIADYVRYLQENPQELDLLYRELLIGVTSFFRDPAMWEVLEKKAIPMLLASRPAGTTLRIWVAACSTGEEAYSLAMVFREALEALRPPQRFQLQIFATDLDKTAIEKARLGVFPAGIAADVSAKRLAKFFKKEPSGTYRIDKEIRDLVVFAPQNLIADPPFTKLDVLSCRNLLIYLSPELHAKLIPLFHYSLKPDGVLLLGSAESTGRFNELFEPVDRMARVFRKKPATATSEPLLLPASQEPARPDFLEPSVPAPTGPNLKAIADDLLLQHFSPPAVLVTDEGDILYISGRTGNYLEPAAGKANWNIFAMAREGLRSKLLTAFHKVVRQRGSITLHEVRVGTDGEQHLIDVMLQALEAPRAVRGTVLIVFANPRTQATEQKGRGKAAKRRDVPAHDLEQEIQRLQADLSTAREEMQTSQEELKSANEELQSTNEELQSTNEELTTSKEEMQSLNEELQSVNAELQSKIDDLIGANDDLKNLLNAIDVGTVFLDSNLRVRRFTTRAAHIIRLIASDIGRPITDISSALIYPDFTVDVARVLNTLVISEKEVQAIDGGCFVVRIMPYSTDNSQMDGVVITFNDVSAAKTLEAELRGRGTSLRTVLESISEGVIFQDGKGAITFVNPAAERILGLTLDELRKHPPGNEGWKAIRGDGSPVSAAAYPANVALATGARVAQETIGVLNPTSGNRVWLRLSATPIGIAGDGKAKQVFTVFEDITERSEAFVQKKG